MQKSRQVQGLLVARATGLEPATSGVTGRRSNQLSYARRGSEDSAQPYSIEYVRAMHGERSGGGRRSERGAGLARDQGLRLVDPGSVAPDHGGAAGDGGGGGFADGYGLRARLLKR
jgi:hypothetical protein